MISRAERQYSQLEIESILEGPVREWFKSKYKEFTPPQRYSIMEIHEGKNVLISSPTGSGKTLSAFMGILNELIRLGRGEQLEDRVYAIYISPLKALNNDIRKNLEEPLAEIRSVFESRGAKMPDIRVGVRTGDTPQAEKSKMLRKPPHILITTPESLAIILNAPKFSEKLANAKYVVVDEIHALAENKRGVHLSLSLERLAAMQNAVSSPKQETGDGKPEAQNGEFVRIGLSATVSPLEEVAKFLVGAGRDCLVVDVNYLKKTKIYVASPIEDLVYTPTDKAISQTYDLLDKIISMHKTTLIFTNTRSATERVVHHLKTRFGDKYVENVAAHHSSLSREHRLDVEEKLKKGELKVVVSSTSLELGIDIGTIDVVVLLGSPKSVSRALQRIGRSGHKLHEVSQGVIVALDRDDLIEDVVLAYDARNRKFDKVRIYRNALDVLAQHIVGMALERAWNAEDAFNVVRKSYCYSDLKREDFEDVLKYLSGYYSMLEERYVYGKIWYDGDEFGKRGKSARAIYYMNIGTIADEPKIHVYADDKRYIGEIEEEFAERLIAGDVFVLGGKTYEFVTAIGNRAYANSASSKRPTVPAWFSEMLPLSYELALDIEKFRHEALRMGEKELSEKYDLNEKTAKAVAGYLREQEKFSIVPDGTQFLVEEWKDDDGLPNYIFHTLCGRKANDSIARVFAYELGLKKKCNISTSISDYGFVLRLPKGKFLTKFEIEEALWVEDFEKKLLDALENSELLKRRFKNVAMRSYLILRRYPGREMPFGMMQVNSEILLRIIKENLPDFPMLKEAYREITQDAMHIDEAMDYIEKLRRRHLVINAPSVPSPFAFNLVSLAAKDIIAVEDRREFIKKMHERLMKGDDSPSERMRA